MEKLTIKDIAQMVNVSTATISNYLNGNYSKMSTKTKNKIEQMIQETKYIPSSIAHDLATNDTKTIGVSVADITNPFTSTVLSGIYDACGILGYTVIFTNSNSDPSQEIENINKLKRQNVSGLIIDPVDAQSPIFKTLSNDDAVMLDREAMNIQIDTVVTDNFNAVNNFVSTMLKEEYDEMYFITWPIEQVSTRLLRYQGFLEATKYKDDSHCVEISNHGNDIDKLKETLNKIIIQNKNKKIGFFSMNGKVLISLIQAMRSLNKRYPENYGIGSYEDLDWMKIMTPGISCVHQDSFDMGVTSVKTLINKLGSDNKVENNPKRIVVTTRMELRDSF
ncbi:Sugar binding transcriptional regulator RegR [Paucilactobacillus oligofermentans DSM 15707 = LMG 22743]|uniref:LacI family DNA-binding transcriptional regulator n=1 Tax=Paucilactobacillus oligofermentans TaxID=293371 RepID=UPI00070BD424|nr:LacI family DNA-binding transcriptional regulator [Paucilactobacillus oligofermentans]CUS25419.1 Sugar binding transcriptional regulator RegR [Paucilactobacillus oligofermentans DSM 15707 = LMG 22743]